MIDRAVADDKQKILDYIGENYGACLYLYLNFKKYGCSSPSVTTYIAAEKDSGWITGVMLKYYSCLHVYSEGGMDTAECTDFIEKEKPEVLFVNADYSQKLEKVLSARYEKHEMQVVEKKSRGDYMIPNVYRVTYEELPEVAAFLMTDRVYNTVYQSKEELTAQMQEREKANYGCTYAARDENKKLIWTSSVVARDDTVCLESLILLASNLRKKGLGKPAVATLANIFAGGGTAYLHSLSRTPSASMTH